MRTQLVGAVRAGLEEARAFREVHGGEPVRASVLGHRPAGHEAVTAEPGRGGAVDQGERPLRARRPSLRHHDLPLLADVGGHREHRGTRTQLSRHVEARQAVGSVDVPPAGAPPRRPAGRDGGRSGVVRELDTAEGDDHGAGVAGPRGDARARTELHPDRVGPALGPVRVGRCAAEVAGEGRGRGVQHDVPGGDGGRDADGASGRGRGRTELGVCRQRRLAPVRDVPAPADPRLLPTGTRRQGDEVEHRRAAGGPGAGHGGVLPVDGDAQGRWAQVRVRRREVAPEDGVVGQPGAGAGVQGEGPDAVGEVELLPFDEPQPLELVRDRAVRSEHPAARLQAVREPAVLQGGELLARGVTQRVLPGEPPGQSERRDAEDRHQRASPPAAGQEPQTSSGGERLAADFGRGLRRAPGLRRALLRTGPDRGLARRCPLGILLRQRRESLGQTLGTARHMLHPRRGPREDARGLGAGPVLDEHEHGRGPFARAERLEHVTGVGALPVRTLLQHAVRRLTQEGVHQPRLQLVRRRVPVPPAVAVQHLLDEVSGAAGVTGQQDRGPAQP